MAGRHTHHRASPERCCFGWRYRLIRRNRRLFAHRLVNHGSMLSAGTVLTRGDAVPSADPPLLESDLLGKVCVILRKNKRIEPRRSLRLLQRAVATLIQHSDLVARIVLRLHRMLQSSYIETQTQTLRIKPHKIELSLPELTTAVGRLALVIEIGGVPVRVNTTDAVFLGMLQDRYAGFVTSSARAEVEFDVDLTPPHATDPNADVRVIHRLGRWSLERGDFRAQWEPSSRSGWIRQTANPYSIDAVLRIVHTLVLARQGGFLLHSASAIRNGKAFLFAGVSEAGKTTISRLAPPDVTLLTDEISYVRKRDSAYIAYGIPLTGELAKLGENVSAPIAALYFLLGQGCSESHRAYFAWRGGPHASLQSLVFCRE